MKPCKLNFISLAATIAMLASRIVAAQEVIPLEVPEEDRNFVGLGVFSIPDYYGSKDNQGAVAPLFRYTFSGERYVQLLGPELTLNLLNQKQWRTGLLVRARARRDDDVDDPIVKQMRPVPTATEVGAFAAYDMPLDNNRPLHKLVLSGDIMGNTNGVYNGASGNVRVSYHYPFQQRVAGYPVVGSVGFGMFFASSSFNRRYFGVSGSDLALYPNLGGQEYRPDGGLTSVKIPFTLTTQLDKKWLLIFAGRYERLLGDAKDSPVVDVHGDANQWALGIATSYRF